VALSEEEQRLLEQMEAALAAEDPKLVNTLRGTGVRKVHRRRAAIAGVGFFAGLALLVVGLYLMSTGPTGFVALSILGFVIMVAAAVTAIYSWQHVGAVTPHSGGDRPRAPQGTSSDGTFMDKMEERWRRRRDESGF
jgi:hypothetical protein